MPNASRFRALCSALVLSLLAVSLLAGPARGEALAPGKGNFSFADPRSTPHKPLTVWYYKPAQATRDSRLVFVMTGVKRNGEDYRNHWVRHAEKYNFILVVPEFPRRDYTHPDDYTFGGVTTNDRAHWGYQTLEYLFDALRQREHLSATRYTIYGHSAGAQFVHRLVLFMGEDARYDTAVAANAGWYTLPVYDDDPLRHFPRGLDARITPESALPGILARRVLIMLGDRDTDPDHPALNRTPAAMAQGDHRYARGQYFYAQAQARATALGVPFNWEMRFVPGVAHSDKGMSNAAVKALFGE